MSTVKCDSRLVQPGDTFVAISGAATDGLRFVDAALQAGATEIVSEAPRPTEGVPENVIWRTVADTRAEIAELACREFGDPSKSLAVFGVTGTNGKTTTATLLRKILNDAHIPAGLVSTISNITAPPRRRTLIDRFIGRPATERNETVATNTTPGPLELQSLFAEMLRNGCRSAVMEVSSHAIDQRRIAGTHFAGVAFTNLTQDHLDYHLTMENYYQAKRKLFMPPQSPAAINLDCPYGRRLIDEIKASGSSTVLSFGSASDADVRFSDERLSHDGTSFLLTYPGGADRLHIKLMGRHNIHNVLTAFSLAFLHGIPAHRAMASLATAEPVRGRLERVRLPASPASFFVDYAHTPDAIENVLKTLREITTGRLFIVFGAGGDRDRRKRPLMGRAAASLADGVIVTSDNPRSENPEAIIEEVLAGIRDYETESGKAPQIQLMVEPDRRTAIRRAVLLADRAGDVVLIAGKGHETYQIFADHTDHFDDREELISWGS